MHSYTYDAEGKVLQVDSGTTAKYVYDVMEQRVRVTTQSEDTEYMFDPFGRRQSSWNVSNNSGSEGRIYWDYGLLANRSGNGQTYFHHGNYLGTDRARTNYLGQSVATLSSGPYGENFQQNSNDGWSTQDNNHYTGQEHDNLTGTDHFLFRQYQGTLGRWMSPDPYDGSYSLDPQSLNRYAYVMGNPLGFVDPDGLTIVCGPPKTLISGVAPMFARPPVYCVDTGDAGSASTAHGGGYKSPPPPKPAPNKPQLPSCRKQNLALSSLSRLSAFSHRGLFVGASLGGSITAVGGGVTRGYYADPSGTVSVATSYSFATAAGGSVTGGFTFGISNYRNGGFGGYSTEATVSAGAGLNASSTYTFNADGYGTMLTIGGGAGISANGGGSYTKLTPVCQAGGSVLDF